LRIIRKVGIDLIETKRSVILAEKASAGTIRDKDIISLLSKSTVSASDMRCLSHPSLSTSEVKGNLASDPSKRLSDSVLLDQLSTLLFAGSDTTALSISWCIHLLSLNPDHQTRLRQEILSLPANSSSYSDSSGLSSPTFSEAQSCASAGGYSEYFQADAIEALPFLDAVVHETLRLCSPVHSTIRTATQDDTIPISSPVVLRDGTVITPSEGIPIRKGTFVHIPIEGLNMSEEIWGKDAREFKYVGWILEVIYDGTDASSYSPCRWFNLPENARAPTHQGLANVMSFSLGPHSCPGWKLSILETKVFLSVILPHFIFTPAEDIRKSNSILMRPYVFDQFEHGSRLPVKVELYRAA
jgi:cytochrome P450